MILSLAFNAAGAEARIMAFARGAGAAEFSKRIRPSERRRSGLHRILDLLVIPAMCVEALGRRRRAVAKTVWVRGSNWNARTA